MCGRSLACKGKGGSDRASTVDPFAVWDIFLSNQWSTTGPLKSVVGVVLSVGMCIQKIPCCLLERVAYVVTVGFI